MYVCYKFALAKAPSTHFDSYVHFYDRFLKFMTSSFRYCSLLLFLFALMISCLLIAIPTCVYIATASIVMYLKLVEAFYSVAYIPVPISLS